MSLCEEEGEEGVGGFHGNQDVFSVSVSVCGHWEGVPMTLVSLHPQFVFRSFRALLSCPSGSCLSVVRCDEAVLYCGAESTRPAQHDPSGFCVSVTLTEGGLSGTIGSLYLTE